MSGGSDRRAPAPRWARDIMSEVARRMRLWPWLLLLTLSLGVSGLILWIVWPSVSGPLDSSFRPTAPTLVPRLAGGERRHVKLFLPQEGGDALWELDRDLTARPTVAESVRDVVRSLMVGAPGVRSPLPAGAQIRQVFLDDLGILYLDFSKEIQAIGSAGGLQASLSVSALVTTLTTNFSEVKRVRLLSEGHELAGMVGEADLGRPILPYLPGAAGGLDAAQQAVPTPTQ